MKATTAKKHQPAIQEVDSTGGEPRPHHIHTLTFRYPARFRKALAASLGRPGQIATVMDVAEFMREAVMVNVAACIEDHLAASRPRLKARVKRRSS